MARHISMSTPKDLAIFLSIVQPGDAQKASFHHSLLDRNFPAAQSLGAVLSPELQLWEVRKGEGCGEQNHTGQMEVILSNPCSIWGWFGIIKWPRLEMMKSQIPLPWAGIPSRLLRVRSSSSEPFPAKFWTLPRTEVPAFLENLFLSTYFHISRWNFPSWHSYFLAHILPLCIWECL